MCFFPDEPRLIIEIICLYFQWGRLGGDTAPAAEIGQLQDAVPGRVPQPAVRGPAPRAPGGRAPAPAHSALAPGVTRAAALPSVQVYPLLLYPTPRLLTFLDFAVIWTVRVYPTETCLTVISTVSSQLKITLSLFLRISPTSDLILFTILILSGLNAIKSILNILLILSTLLLNVRWDISQTINKPRKKKKDVCIWGGNFIKGK